MFDDDDDFTTADNSKGTAGWETHTFQLDGRDRAPTVTIIEAIAAVSGVASERLPPLQEYVDTDALDVLIADGVNGDSTDVHISFYYEQLEVTIDGHGNVEIRWIR